MGRPEDSRVKIPALVHFTRLGYSYMSIKNKQVGIDYDGENRTVDVHIKRLRERYSSNTDFEIVTVRGLGYKAVKLGK